MRKLTDLKGFAREEDGAVLAEYGILLVLITLALVGTIVLFSGAIISAFEDTIEVIEERGGAEGGGGGGGET